MDPRIAALLVLLSFAIMGGAVGQSPTAETPAPVQPLPSDVAVAVLGKRVRTPDGHDVGRLVDLLVDDTGEPRAAVLDFGGFMGVGNRKVVVEWKSLHFYPAEKDRPILLDLTPDQIKAAPEYKSAATSASVVVAPANTGPPPTSAPAESAPTAQTQPPCAETKGPSEAKPPSEGSE